jgi:cbb3-type cytochrome oxidase subunit 3
VEIGAIIVWAILAVLVLVLLGWWWLGVHRKSRNEQAAKLAAEGAARRERGSPFSDTPITTFDPPPN